MTFGEKHKKLEKEFRSLVEKHKEYKRWFLGYFDSEKRTTSKREKIRTFALSRQFVKRNEVEVSIEALRNMFVASSVKKGTRNPNLSFSDLLGL